MQLLCYFGKVLSQGNSFSWHGTASAAIVCSQCAGHARARHEVERPYSKIDGARFSRCVPDDLIEPPKSRSGGTQRTDGRVIRRTLSGWASDPGLWISSMASRRVYVLAKHGISGRCRSVRLELHHRSKPSDPESLVAGLNEDSQIVPSIGQNWCSSAT